MDFRKMIMAVKSANVMIVLKRCAQYNVRMGFRKMTMDVKSANAMTVHRQVA
jgi:hypothetical protein